MRCWHHLRGGFVEKDLRMKLRFRTAKPPALLPAWGTSKIPQSGAARHCGLRHTHYTPGTSVYKRNLAGRLIRAKDPITLVS